MNDGTHTYDVPDISCDHCKRRIEDHVKPVQGVENITVDIDNKLVTVTGGDSTAIAAAIASAGYTIA